MLTEVTLKLNQQMLTMVHQGLDALKESATNAQAMMAKQVQEQVEEDRRIESMHTDPPA